ncbi:chemotaxis response regulator protein-glutamate methylesterase [Pelagicoccus sp. SDUM812002]|uniref:protein-glutamate methylesterase/protein-glutamine glutaminase n=1 Tax=Pelagicoccus sp. SDUM812002 TaxID=3041266 RepID=UPI00280FC8A6|nr:chemotaxis response regulator protein-glutamate methylesterase [Pelagicoccus sp. SDUM812002]MDQ8184786.1 chemotaxis response regulator protein-glutamate methylesterase [Pelagicoccus sp. SDUM812002]
MKKIRVLVVDDTAVMRKIVSEVVDRDPEMETAGVAANGRIALQRVNQVSPDLITLDMEMPEMGGIEMVRELRKTHPRIPVIMLSSLTVKGAEATFDALQAGASDYVAKPARSIGIPATLAQLQAELLPRIRHFFPQKKQGQPETPTRRNPFAARSRHSIEVVALATSTGGPNALAKVFHEFKEPLPVPVVIVQHMPPIFTRTLAERLNSCSVMSVHEGEDGQVLQAGHAYLAPGGYHMETRREGTRFVLRLTQDPPENSCRPAADVLFRSVAGCFGASTLAVVMTGMGRDGFLGTQVICQRGGSAIAQDEASSVVWGMPSYLAKEGLAESVLPLDQIASKIESRVSASLQLG